jgi:citrate synthase
MEPWRSAIANSDQTNLWIRGYDVTELMQRTTFADVVFLLHQSRLPSPDERKLIDAILIAVADHGAGAPSCAAARLVASGNRESLSAAVAAGVLAIGDEHGGAGADCMDVIALGTRLANTEKIPIEQGAGRIFDEFRSAKKRLPGLGHRVHRERDPRTEILFNMARQSGLARDGVAFMQALEKVAGDRGKVLPINIDGALAAILYDLGFPSALGKLLFIIGRVAGLTAEVAEEHSREKAMRVKIPIVYDGPPPRPLNE